MRRCACPGLRLLGAQERTREGGKGVPSETVQTTWQLLDGAFQWQVIPLRLQYGLPQHEVVPQSAQVLEVVGVGAGVGSEVVGAGVWAGVVPQLMKVAPAMYADSAQGQPLKA